MAAGLAGEKGFVVVDEPVKVALHAADETTGAVGSEVGVGQGAEFGYVPDPGVAALARRRKNAVGNRYPLVWLWERKGKPSGEDAVLITAVKREVEARGYSLELARVDALGGPKAAGRVLAARGVVGVFVSSLDRADVVEHFAWERFAVVSFLQENYVLPFDSVRPDLFYLMFEAWRRARATGVRRIGAVIPSSYIARENELLLSACAYHMRDLPMALPALILQPRADGGTEHYPAETVRWFKRHRPEVVIGKTEGAYWALKEAGWECPQNFRFLALRRTDVRDWIAGFDWQTDLLAESMAGRMHTLISFGWRGARETPGTWMIPGKWCDGDYDL